jgi:tRNA/rRNA methyltransferase
MNCRVVMVRPQFAANIGAVARVMRNMGLADLVLVAPQGDPTDHQARQLATHGEEVLTRCRIVAELGEAVADCVLVAGTSARVGGLMRRQFVGPPEEIAPRLVEAMQNGPVALVFGPETNGLTNDEVTRCHYLIHIPTDPTYAALNLAQAVAICTYEVRRQWLQQANSPTLLPSSETPAPFAEQERAYEHLRQALEDVHFLWNEKADALMHMLRHLIGRAGPTPMEVDVLHGLARQLRWFARRRGGSP